MDSRIENRDRGLDYLKGAACLLMILAHGMVADTAGWVQWVKFIGQYAPILFFAGSGAAMTYQAQKRRILPVVLFYAAFFILGFSYNGLHVSDYWHALSSDILQCIAMGSIILVLLLRVLPARALMVLSPIPFLLHVLLQRWIVPADFVLREMLIPPGIFPILPWLGFFLLGAGAYRLRDWIKAEVFIGLAVLLAVLAMMGVPMDMFNKWNMSWGYFLVSCAGVVLAFLLARWGRNLGLGPLEKLGRYSLLFLYVHYIPVYLLHDFGVDAPWIVWPVILIVTPLMMTAFYWINEALCAGISQQWWFWLILLGLVIAAPYLSRYKMVIHVISYITGILFALNYRGLMGLIQRMVDRIRPREEATA